MSIFKKASKFHEKHLLAVSFPLCMGMVLSAWSPLLLCGGNREVQQIILLILG